MLNEYLLPTCQRVYLCQLSNRINQHLSAQHVDCIDISSSSCQPVWRERTLKVPWTVEPGWYGGCLLPRTYRCKLISAGSKENPQGLASTATRIPIQEPQNGGQQQLLSSKRTRFQGGRRCFRIDLDQQVITIKSCFQVMKVGLSSLNSLW